MYKLIQGLRKVNKRFCNTCSLELCVNNYVFSGHFVTETTLYKILSLKYTKHLIVRGTLLALKYNHVNSVGLNQEYIVKYVTST